MTRTTLLLLPGMLNDETLWADVAPHLDAWVDVRCAPAFSQESIPAMADASWKLLSDLPPDAPVTLLGFSMGGYVAIEMLSRPARSLRAVVLVSTSARGESPEARAAREKTIAAMQRNFERVVDGILAFSTHGPGAYQHRLKQMMLGVGVETAIRQNRAVMERNDHGDDLAKCDLPVTVICGREDRVTPPELSQELAARVPGARLKLLDQCGHMLPVEQPAQLVDLLCEIVA